MLLTPELPSPPEKCNLSQSSSQTFFLVHCLPASQLEKEEEEEEDNHPSRRGEMGDEEDEAHKMEYYLEVYSDYKKNPIVMMNDQLPQFNISVSELPSNESNIFVVYSRNSNGKSSDVLLTSESHKMLGSEANLTGMIKFILINNTS